MAKAKKKKAKSDGAKAKGTSRGPLQPALDTFAGGDYVAARRMFEGALADPELSEENRHVAKTLLQSIGIDRGTLYVGLACVGLYLLAILVAVLKQP